ncbi:MAG: endolytic transglycosylase MltG [Firmicutes bacterium]|nr:endolytic transglycosylase MltG [Bacillota bacterium]
MHRRLAYPAIVLALLVILVGIGVSTFQTKPAGQSVRVEIPAGASSAEISQILEEAGVVSDAWIFRAYAKLAGVEGTLKAGHYQLETAMPVIQLLRVLVKGTPETIAVTITEGQTLKEIARTLEEAGIVNAVEFQRLAYDPKYVLGDEMPHWLLGAKSLEGFLFPDTYLFAPGQGAREVLRVMFKQFLAKTEELREKSPYVAQLGVVRWVTLASIVEKEGRLPEELPIIASVFANRLERGMYLQSCATIQYALGRRKPQLTEEDLQVDSPYNTYKNGGLPPGPIASPGLSALKAAAYPAETDYLYFVAKGDGSHIFSKNYREHLRAKTQAEKGTE